MADAFSEWRSALKRGDVAFLHRVDFEKRKGLFVSTSPSRVRSPSFLDGRERFWDQEFVAPLSDTKPADASKPAYIFHVSFCGSTLLATLLDLPGSVLAIKEPHALVDASDWVNRHAEATSSIPGVLHTIEKWLVEPASAGEVVVVKPSNWANNLISHLCDPLAATRAIFVSMQCYEFLKAVFRGGRDRMAYTARVTAHLASSEASRELLREAIAGGTDPLDQIARMAGLLHRLQEHTFREALHCNGWDRRHWVDFSQLLNHPVETVLGAASALTLYVDAADLEERVARRITKHSKSLDITFSADRRVIEDQEVERHYHAVLKRAADWSGSLVI